MGNQHANKSGELPPPPNTSQNSMSLNSGAAAGSSSSGFTRTSSLQSPLGSAGLTSTMTMGSSNFSNSSSASSTRRTRGGSRDIVSPILQISTDGVGHDQDEAQHAADDWAERSGSPSSSTLADAYERRLKRRAPSSAGSSTSSISQHYDEEKILEKTSGINLSDVVSLKDFEILKRIGKGSHGTVYLVQHRESNRLYVMKTMKKSEVIRKKQVDHAWTEFRVLKRLAGDKARCPYIAPMRFAFHSPSRLYLVFDYCSGGELYFHLGRRGRLPESYVKFYAAEIIVSIGYLHACGIVFRDLKPENLVLDTLGHMNLVDFGLCKEDIRCPAEGVNSFSGTTEYLAPEILTGRGSGLALDWWAFGMILYEMMVGLPPWYDQDQDVMVRKIVNDPLMFPDHVSMSDEAKHLICNLLIKDPMQRLGSRGGGSSEILTHAFFRGTDWIKIARRAVEPPFVPPATPANSLSEDTLPGICNFEIEFTSVSVVQPPTKDYLPPVPGDLFNGFYFDYRR